MAFIPKSTFTNLREVSMNHLPQMRHARWERLPIRTPGSVTFLKLTLILEIIFPILVMILPTFRLENSSVLFIYFALRHIRRYYSQIMTAHRCTSGHLWRRIDLLLWILARQIRFFKVPGKNRHRIIIFVVLSRDRTPLPCRSSNTS